ncbi:hypothetical protein [Thiobacillus sp.]|uniref:hypothetical protein n=1 Tax=Thiobacillus sp. TaxID=924 RepID=UPI0011D7993B|nr:hypothetical protein [Thiobacillus sp.]TXH73187.1 MAG: hypothetical protein E6Q82_14875 [Thiobacillus sp.]
MNTDLRLLLDLTDLHGEKGKELFSACTGELFPCDALGFAVLERSLNLLKGFHLLLSNGGYTPGVGLLRMQLDNVLRFHGIVKSADPHDTANLIFHGVSLRTLKDRSGKKMTDARLVELLSSENPWVDHVYNLACSYIHLSDQHMHHFLLRSKKDDAGMRDITIGDEDDHVEHQHKVQLIKAFAVVTRGVLELIRQWSVIRHQHGTNEQLKSRFVEAI